MKKINYKILIIGFLIIFFVVGIFFVVTNNDDSEYVSYKNFNEFVTKDEVKFVSIEDEKLIFMKKDDNKKYYTNNPDNENLKEKLLLKDIDVKTNSGVETLEFVFDIIFYLIFFGMVGFGAYKLFSFSNGNFEVIKKTNVNFDDIAGMDELKKEMSKAVDILKNKKAYEEKGIRPIKGIILEGNPGNGKTLFAKALATETDVKFIATKGADFQSAMMSMGARKIKMLFKKARKNSPCIIFIDEFDGIGERRNYAGTGVDKENNRIITAMLNEMDGFTTTSGILVIAATNSYASLDPALIRPGRFDLKYNIPNPDYNTRVKLIDLYTKNKKLDEKIDKAKLSEAFENLSCSSIEAIINEASMIASMQNSDNITIENIIISAQKTNCRINLKKIMR